MKEKKRINILKLIAGIVFFVMGISYIYEKEYIKAVIEIGIGIILASPVLYRYIKEKAKK